MGVHEGANAASLLCSVELIKLAYVGTVGTLKMEPFTQPRLQKTDSGQKEAELNAFGCSFVGYLMLIYYLSRHLMGGLLVKSSLSSLCVSGL